MLYLLDTNILSDFMRHPSGPCRRRAALVGETNIATSIIVAAELRFGVEKKNSLILEQRLEGVLARFQVLPVEAPVDLVYARIRFQLESEGQPISGNDTLIAAHAMALGATLVTDNMKEFSRIDGLLIENWLR